METGIKYISWSAYAKKETTHLIYDWVATRHILEVWGTKKDLLSPHCTEPQPAQPALYTLYRLHYYHSKTNTVKKITVHTNLLIFLSHMTIFWDSAQYWLIPLFCVGS
jgi:hypothetical protein